MSDEIQSLNDDKRDRALMRAAAAGDRTAFGVLVTHHQASVFRLAQVLVRQSADAEDVLQQTFLSAWRAASQFRGDASVLTWLLTITRNAALTKRTQHAREPLDDTPLEALGIRAGWGGPNPEELASLAERRDWVMSALARLPADEREILTLREFDGLSGEDTAAVLGLSLPAMKSRLHRARLALAALIREEGADATR